MILKKKKKQCNTLNAKDKCSSSCTQGTTIEIYLYLDGSTFVYFKQQKAIHLLDTHSADWNITYIFKIYLNILKVKHKHKTSSLKALMSITFHPQGSTESSILCVCVSMSNESLHFSHYNLKISASNSLYFGKYTRKCTHSSIPIDFLMYFNNSLIPSVKYLFLPQERK